MIIIFPVYLFAEIQIEVDVSAKNKQKIPIYIVKFAEKNKSDELAGINNEIFNTILNDLNFSEDFKIYKNDKSSFLDFTLPNTLVKLFKNAEYVIEGEIGYMLNDEIYVKVKIYDLFLKQYKLFKNYYGNKKFNKRIAHKISNDILEKLTDEKGIFTDKILYVSNKTGNKEIYIMDYDGKGSHPLTANHSVNIAPEVFGDNLYFTSFLKGNARVFKKNLRTGSYDILIKKGSFSAGADFNPIKKVFVAMFENGGDSEIGIFNFQGKLIKQITNNIFNESSPVWSHNGKYIAFVSNRSGTPQIYLYNSEKGFLRRITFTTKYSAYPSWSPNDKYIFFSALIDGKFQICKTSTYLMHYEQITSDNASNEFPTLHPDGKYLLFTKSIGGARQIFIKNIETEKLYRVTHDRFDYSYPKWYIGKY